MLFFIFHYKLRLVKWTYVDKRYHIRFFLEQSILIIQVYISLRYFSIHDTARIKIINILSGEPGFERAGFIKTKSIKVQI